MVYNMNNTIVPCMNLALLFGQFQSLSLQTSTLDLLVVSFLYYEKLVATSLRVIDGADLVLYNPWLCRVMSSNGGGWNPLS